MKSTAPLNSAKRDSEQGRDSDTPPRRLSSPLSHALWELASDLKAQQISLYGEAERIKRRHSQITDELLAIEGCRQPITEALMVSGDTGVV